MNRNAQIQRLAEETFDLCIIGAGASGAGCALDAASRGLKVALIDQADFGSATSSKSTKLIHGGVRYLEQAFKKWDFAQLKQVKHGLLERRILLQNAPHLAQPLGIITPVFHWWEGLYYRIGLKLYDWFAHNQTDQPWPSSKWLSKKEALALAPELTPGIHSAILYYDGQLNDSRYTLALVQTALQFPGTVAANYLALEDFEKDTSGKITGAMLRNLAPDPGGNTHIIVKASVFLNCTGPYSDKVRQLANPALPQRMSPSKGVHLTLPAHILNSRHALLIPKTADGRMVFAIPFEGKTILGTTDEPCGVSPNEPLLQSRDILFLLDTLRPYLQKPLDQKAVQAGFGGIRPLLAAAPDRQDKQTKSLLRDHEVETDPISGLISLLGGKWTTYRVMAQDAVDMVGKMLPVGKVLSKSGTEHLVLIGARQYDTGLAGQLQTRSGLPAETCRHLAHHYGDQASKLLALVEADVRLIQRIHPDFPFICAEIVYAARYEMAVKLRDFIARRIRMEILDWEAAWASVPVVAHWMGIELGWTPEYREQQQLEYEAILEQFIRQSKL